jgi:hypothetical protein
MMPPVPTMVIITKWLSPLTLILQAEVEVPI